MNFVLLPLVLWVISAVTAVPTVDPLIAKALLPIRSVTTILVSFVNSNAAGIRAQVKRQRFGSSSARAQKLYEELKSHADSTQRNATRLISRGRGGFAGVRTLQLWATNQLIIYYATPEVITSLSRMEGISAIEKDRKLRLAYSNLTLKAVSFTAGSTGNQWGVEAVQAPEIWASGNRGAGIVVANIDTGVRSTHEALRDGFRADHGWYDPLSGSHTPKDDSGHGTHTMGTICGSKNGIGVAPGAKWIACRACDSTGCDLSATLACGQWITCPTDPYGNKPNCALKPHVVSNSWGGGQDDPFFDGIIETWEAAHIVPLFATGNDGPGCGIVASPADSKKNAIAIGATDDEDQLASFSNTGPPADGSGRQKPEFVAPGDGIVSAFLEGNSDSEYYSLSGTSMACPHAAGVAALLLSRNPSLTTNDVRDLLREGAEGTAPVGYSCGVVSEDSYPNYMVGYGRINAKSSYDRM